MKLVFGGGGAINNINHTYFGLFYQSEKDIRSRLINTGRKIKSLIIIVWSKRKREKKNSLITYIEQRLTNQQEQYKALMIQIERAGSPEKKGFF